MAQRLRGCSGYPTIVVFVPYDVVFREVAKGYLQQPNSRPSYAEESMFFALPYDDARSFPQRNLSPSDLHLKPIVKSYPEFFPMLV
jgi:hypothetical protein